MYILSNSMRPPRRLHTEVVRAAAERAGARLDDVSHVVLVDTGVGDISRLGYTRGNTHGDTGPLRGHGSLLALCMWQIAPQLHIHAIRIPSGPSPTRSALAALNSVPSLPAAPICCAWSVPPRLKDENAHPDLVKRIVTVNVSDTAWPGSEASTFALKKRSFEQSTYHSYVQSHAYPDRGASIAVATATVLAAYGLDRATTIDILTAALSHGATQ